MGHEVALQKGRIGTQKGPVNLEVGAGQHVVYGRLGGQGTLCPRQFGMGEHLLPGDAWIGAQKGPVPCVWICKDEIEEANGWHGGLKTMENPSNL